VAQISNVLIPVHIKLDESQVVELLKKYSLEDTSKLPKIKKNDPALAELGCEVGDVVEIKRSSFAGEGISYYRVVVE
jgi:DNA-directed RNA polymerase subunit H (RpoH/RPB5)